jgi:glutathione S-transferase
MYLEACLRERSYLVADELTIADISVAGMMTYFRYTQFPFNSFLSISKWFSKIEALSSWQKTEEPLWIV